MSNIDFSLSVNAREIDKKLTGLRWITPIFPEEPEKQIRIIIIESAKIVVVVKLSYI